MKGERDFKPTQLEKGIVLLFISFFFLGIPLIIFDFIVGIVSEKLWMSAFVVISPAVGILTIRHCIKRVDDESK